MAYLVYVTHPHRDAALSLARELVHRQLAAGVNIIPAAQSVYRWQGAVQEKEECLLLAQVSAAAWEDFCAAVCAAHPYEVPCIVALPVQDGLRPFVQWIDANSLPAPKPVAAEK